MLVIQLIFKWTFQPLLNKKVPSSSSEFVSLSFSFSLSYQVSSYLHPYSSSVCASVFSSPILGFILNFNGQLDFTFISFSFTKLDPGGFFFFSVFQSHI